MAKLWFNKADVNGQIKTVMSAYNTVMSNAQKVQKTMETYINKKGKWNDDVSKVFAEWWNQSGKSTGGGKLVIDSKGNLTTTKSNSQSDGEDRIKWVVQAAGMAFYMSVCKSLAALSGSYNVKEYAETKAYVNIVSATYDNKIVSDMKGVCSGTTWSKMMKQLGAKSEWTNMKLPLTNAAAGGTSSKELENMTKELNTNLTNLNNSVDDYIAKINKLANNSVTTKGWGFDTTVRQNLITGLNKLNKTSQNQLKSFVDSTKVALKACDQNVTKAMTNLNIKFS